MLCDIKSSIQHTPPADWLHVDVVGLAWRHAVMPLLPWVMCKPPYHHRPVTRVQDQVSCNDNKHNGYLNFSFPSCYCLSKAIDIHGTQGRWLAYGLATLPCSTI